MKDVSFHIRPTSRSLPAGPCSAGGPLRGRGGRTRRPRPHRTASAPGPPPGPRALRIVEQPAARVGNHLREGPVVRQHDRHSAGPGLQHRQPLALADQARQAQHVERFQECDLARTVQFADILEAVGQPQAAAACGSHRDSLDRTDRDIRPRAAGKAASGPLRSSPAAHPPAHASPLSAQIRLKKPMVLGRSVAGSSRAPAVRPATLPRDPAPPRRTLPGSSPAGSTSIFSRARPDIRP